MYQREETDYKLRGRRQIKELRHREKVWEKGEKEQEGMREMER